MVQTQTVEMPTYVKHDNLQEIYSGDKLDARDYFVSNHLHPFDGIAYSYNPSIDNWDVNNDKEWNKIRVIRDGLINSFYWKVDRQRDRILTGEASQESILPLLQYVEILRNIPQTQEDPLNVVFPEAPTI
jgi:hypothetical protein